MAYSPGDPYEQRKKALLAKLMGGRGGRAGGGFRVGRPSAAGFGRGIGFGFPGSAGQRGSALPQFLGGGSNPDFGQGAVPAPQFNMGGDIMPIPSAPGPVGPSLIGPQPTFDPQLIQQLLGGYGTPSGRINPGFF